MHTDPLRDPGWSIIPEIALPVPQCLTISARTTIGWPQALGCVIFALLVAFCPSARAQQVATPVFEPPSSYIVLPYVVAITCTTPGASIYYTTDGLTTPSASSLPVPTNGQVLIASTQLLQAIAYAPGLTPSAVASAPYYLTGIVDGGANFGLALKADGTLWAWGLRTNGRLGDGTNGQYSAFLLPNRVINAGRIHAAP
jgi:hypothetical protein